MHIRTFVFLAALGLALSQEIAQPCEQIKIFVNGHNARRLQLAQGKISDQPAAENMGILLWDPVLAEKAAKWALAHTTNKDPDLKTDKFEIGQNIYVGVTSDIKSEFNIQSALNSWFNQYNKYKFGPLTYEELNSATKKIGDYTQMVWADSSYVGCGMSVEIKDGFKYDYVVCNYGPRGNYVGQTPYKPTPIARKELICRVLNCNHPYGASCSEFEEA